jgi:hypothetical protein
LAHERLRNNREVDHSLRERREALGISAGGDDLGVLVRINSKSSQRKPKSQIRGAADPVYTADLSFQLFRRGDVLRGNNMINESADNPQNHDGIGAGQSRAQQRCNRGCGNIDLSGNEGL